MFFYIILNMNIIVQKVAIKRDIIINKVLYLLTFINYNSRFCQLYKEGSYFSFAIFIKFKVLKVFQIIYTEINIYKNAENTYPKIIIPYSTLGVQSM